MQKPRGLAWTGWWTIVVGIIHTIFGFSAYSTGWAAIGRGGFWNAVDGDVVREHAFWFTIFGPSTVLLGVLMVWVERHSGMRLPRFLGWSFVGAAVVICFLMPISGAWLFLPPGIALIMGRSGSR